MNNPVGPGKNAAWSGADLLGLAVVVAGLLSFVELSLVGTAAFILDRWTHLNPQFVWLAPAIYTTVSVILTCLVLLVTRQLRRHHVVRIVAFLAAWIGTTGILFTYHRLHRTAATLVAAGIAVQFAALVAHYPAVSRRWVRRLVGPIVAIPVLAFIVLNGRWALMERRALAALGEPPDGPNVILVIWDTVRASSLSVYGYERETTPTLERLAAEGATFDRAFSTAPWTTPSHASMFTGLYPPQLSTDWRTPLDHEPTVIAEVLAANGYRTAGITGNVFATSRESGLSRGFSHYDDYGLISAGDIAQATALGRRFVTREKWRARLGFRRALGSKDAVRINDQFLHWLDRDPDRPFFAFLNYFDAHSPYNPPAPFDTLWSLPVPDRTIWIEAGHEFTPAELQVHRDAYEASIAYLDYRLGVLLDELRRRGILDNTIVIVTSDHGEEFGEHGVYFHGNTMYDAGLHVPLLVRWPAGVPAGSRTSAFVSNRDIPSTILDLLGIADPVMPGASLSRYWSPMADAPAEPDSIIAAVTQVTGNPPQYPVSRNPIRVLMADPWKFIASGEESVELYNLREDPEEVHNRVADLPELRALLESALARRLQAWRGPRP